MHERDAILRLWENSEKSALATVVEVHGSSYRRAGARMLLACDGQSAGVINGGCLDADLHARAARVMESGVAELACYDTTASQDIVFGLGLGCRGVVKILIEPAGDLSWLKENCAVEVVYEGEKLGTRVLESHQSAEKSFIQELKSPQQLLIFGAGADVAPLETLAQTLGWRMQIVDLRAPNPERATFVASTHIASEKLAGFAIPEGAACVVMTHNFLHDLEILKRVLPSGAAYIGVLGPRRRTDELLEACARDTLLPAISPTPQQLARLFAPIGLDLGAETPAEIALSIVAEIQRFQSGKAGKSLRERESIH